MESRKRLMWRPRPFGPPSASTSISVGLLFNSVREVFTDSCRAKHDFCENRRSDSHTSPEEVNEILLVLSKFIV